MDPPTDDPHRSPQSTSDNRPVTGTSAGEHSATATADQQQHLVHVDMNQMNPVVQSFHFPRTTFGFQDAVVIPGHVEPRQDGNYFAADERPFLWTNPDLVGPGRHRIESRGEIVREWPPEQGLAGGSVGAETGRGIEGLQGFLPDPSSSMAAQSLSTSTQGHPQPPTLFITDPSGPPSPTRQVASTSDTLNLPPTHLTGGGQHRGSVQTSTAPMIDPQLRSLLWNDETSALSGWYDESLDVQRAPSHTSRPSGLRTRPPTADPVLASAMRYPDAAAYHDAPSTAEASSSIPRQGGIDANRHAAEHAPFQRLNASRASASEKRVKKGPTGPRRNPGLPSMDPPVNPRRLTSVLGHTVDFPVEIAPLRGVPRLFRGVTWEESQMEMADRLPDLGQWLPEAGPQGTAGKAPDAHGGLRGGGPKGNTAATGEDVSGETSNPANPRHARRWKGPDDLNVIPIVHESSSFAAAQMPPLTAPATSYGYQVHFPPGSQPFTHREFDSRWFIAEGNPVSGPPPLPVNGEPFAFALDETAGSNFGVQVCTGPLFPESLP